MDNFRIQLPPEILPKLFHVSQVVNDEVHKLLQCPTRSGANSNQCNTEIQLVINVAKATQQSADVHRETSVLATAVTCGKKFVRKSL